MVAGLMAQAPQDAGAAKGKGAKGGAGKGKAAATETKAAPPVIPQVLRLLRPSMYLVTGRGTNTVFKVTAQGVIVVDTKVGNPGEYERLVELIGGVTPQPVKWIVNTNAKPEASGNNAKFLAAGAAALAADRAEAKLIHVGANTAVFFPAEKVIVLGEVAKTDAAVQGVGWTLAVPAMGEPSYK